MEYKDIVRVNSEMTFTDIGKGKDYAEVPQRVQAFRKLFPEGTIKTEILSCENGVCIMQASVYAGDRLLATGTAYEREGAGFVNKTSYIENCETSAVGRALGMAGFGIDTSVASKEEVEQAIAQQEDAKNPGGKVDAGLNNKIDLAKANVLRKKCQDSGINIDKVCELYKINALTDMSLKMWLNAQEHWSELIDKVK